VVVSMATTSASAVGVLSSSLTRHTAEVEVVIDGQQLRGSVCAERREAIVAAHLRRTIDQAGPG
jgi:hypothetical protein